MRKQSLLLCLFALCVMAACTSGERGNKGPGIIDIAGKLEETTTFNASDFGRTIRYIPLETTDESLVANRPKVHVLKKHIIIVTGKQCLLFDKDTGRFITQVGHIGEDPEAYSRTECWADEAEGILYFKRRPNQLMKYNLEGKFVGKIELPNSQGSPSHLLITDARIVAYYNDTFNPNDIGVAFFDKEGNLQDSIPIRSGKEDASINDVEMVNVFFDRTLFGNIGVNAVMFINCKDGKTLVDSPMAPALWQSKGETHFKELFVDTIYNIKENKPVPYITFDTGSYHWPANECTNKENNSKRILVSYVAETNDCIFFQCIQGIHTDTRTLYTGLYNKKSGETRLTKLNNEYTDDLTDFMPFDPRAVSANGEFIGLLEAPDIVEWLEEHPDTKAEGKLAFLKDITEDMNPVVVIVE